MRADVPVDRIQGCLWGCAVGDALGLPAEGLSPEKVRRRFALDRFSLVGRTGFVSDDTEQTALLAQALAEEDTDDGVVRRFRRHLRWWLARLPFGVGFATLRAGLKLWLGFRRSGVGSAGNGAAMRATILGVTVRDRASRVTLGRRLAELTHTHPLAVEGALYVAELAALCARAPAAGLRAALVTQALEVVTEPALRTAIERSLAAPAEPAEAARQLGSTGFVVHSAALATWAFVHGDGVLDTLQLVIRAGGDTDTHAAIVGGWTGALLGAGAIPSLVEHLAPGPFGREHLAQLAESLASGAPLPRWSALVALARNLALYPVVLAHGFRRLIPFG